VAGPTTTYTPSPGMNIYLDFSTNINVIEL